MARTLLRTQAWIWLFKNGIGLSTKFQLKLEGWVCFLKKEGSAVDFFIFFFFSFYPAPYLYDMLDLIYSSSECV